MSQTLSLTSEELRRRFDESFALAPAAPTDETQDFLAIRVGGGKYALRMSDLAGLTGRRKTVPLPSPDQALAGLACAQGQLLPVYRLASLMECGGGEDEMAWLAVCGREEPVGLAFAALDGYLRIARANLYESAPGEQQYSRQALRQADEMRYILDIPAILAGIRARAGIASTPSRS